MKEVLRLKFPYMYFKLSSILKNTYYFKRRNQKRNAIISQRELKIVQEVFKNETTVQNGIFKGMKYITIANGSTLLAKLIGSYEEPIQDWIKEVVFEKKYNKILDIGCAEGYYAVGFASKLPHCEIIAYDIDNEARINLEKLIKLNDVINIQIKSYCDHNELNQHSAIGTLVFCDIEGYEETLLNPRYAPNLKYADLIIESHDCYRPGVTEELIRRFYNTHKIRIIVDYPFRLEEYHTQNMTEQNFKFITDEIRQKYMKFIYMESILNHKNIQINSDN